MTTTTDCAEMGNDSFFSPLDALMTPRREARLQNKKQVSRREETLALLSEKSIIYFEIQSLLPLCVPVLWHCEIWLIVSRRAALW